MSSLLPPSLVSRMVARHIEQLALDAAATLFPNYAAEVRAAVLSADRRALERAMAATLQFNMPDVALPDIIVARGVEGFSEMARNLSDCIQRIEAVREAVGASPNAPLSASDLEELGLPAAISHADDAYRFARRCISDRSFTRGLVMHRYGHQDGSMALSAPVVALYGAAMGLDLDTAAWLAVALLSAPRVLRMAQDADGEAWYVASAQHATAEVWHGLTGWLVQLALPYPSCRGGMESWHETARAIRVYCDEIPLVEDEQVMGESRGMTPERLRGLILRARRSVRRSLRLPDLFREELRGAHPTYPGGWTYLVGAQRGSHRPDPGFVKNERAVIRLLARMVGMTMEDLENTGRKELDALVDGQIVQVQATLQAILDASRTGCSVSGRQQLHTDVLREMKDLLRAGEKGRKWLLGDLFEPKGQKPKANGWSTQTFVWENGGEKGASRGEGSKAGDEARERILVMIQNLRKRLVSLDEAAAAAQQERVSEETIEGEIILPEEEATEAPRGPLLLLPGEPESEAVTQVDCVSDVSEAPLTDDGSGASEEDTGEKP